MFKRLLSALFICLFCAVSAYGMPGSKVQVQSIPGKVLDTMDAGGYTYLLVKNSSGEQWVAIPQGTVKKGQEVRYYDGMVMKNFVSKSLNRTFPTIVFSNGLADEAGASPAPQKTEPSDDFAAAVAEEQGQAEPAGHKGDLPQMSGGSMGAVVPQKDVSIEKAPGENSFTVGEIFEKAAGLDKKTVRVRGQVEKFNPQIMGKNWIHIQDGSGDPMKNTHDLVVTSDDTAEVGSVITIEGVVAAKKDFGAGYSYEVIIEQAKLIP